MSLVTKLVNPFPNKPWFLCVCNKYSRLLKTLWEKEKLLVTSNFSYSHSVFYLSGPHSAFFIKSEIVVCKHTEFGKGLKSKRKMLSFQVKFVQTDTQLQNNNYVPDLSMPGYKNMPHRHQQTVHSILFQKLFSQHGGCLKV